MSQSQSFLPFYSEYECCYGIELEWCYGGSLCHNFKIELSDQGTTSVIFHIWETGAVVEESYTS